MAVEPRRLLTYEDYATFPDDGVRREIVDGEVFERSGPSVRHQRLVLRLLRLFADHLDRHGDGFQTPIGSKCIGSTGQGIQDPRSSSPAARCEPT